MRFKSRLQVISYDSQRGGVSVITEKGDITTSYLLIQNADLADSGRYSCSPSNADVASVRVHVLNGKPKFSFVLKSEKSTQLTLELLLSFFFVSKVTSRWNEKRKYEKRKCQILNYRNVRWKFNNFFKPSVRALISGEHPEAMQTGSCGKSRSYCIVICFVLLTIVYNYIRQAMFLSSSSSSLFGVPSLPPSRGLSPAKFLINFKLEPKQGVCTKFQRISTHAKSWLTKHTEQCKQKRKIAAAAVTSTSTVVESWFSSRFFIL